MISREFLENRYNEIMAQKIDEVAVVDSDLLSKIRGYCDLVDNYEEVKTKQLFRFNHLKFIVKHPYITGSQSLKNDFYKAHNEIIKYLESFNNIKQSKKKKTKEKKVNKISFDRNILIINKHRIDFSGKENQKTLLDFIIKKEKLGDEYCFNDIENDFDNTGEYLDHSESTKSKNHWLYNAARDINSYVKTKARMGEFLITTTKTVRINDKFLNY